MKPFDHFFVAYIEAALWSSNDDEGTPFNSKFDRHQIHPHCLSAMEKECRAFLAQNIQTIDQAIEAHPGFTFTSAGHDFWLTRNHHGAGFWDRGLGDFSDQLTASANGFDAQDIYVGDDGLLYVSGLEPDRIVRVSALPDNVLPSYVW